MFPGRAVAIAVASVLCAGVPGCAEPLIDSTSVLEDTRDQGGPYEVWSVIRDSQTDDFVELFVSVDSEDPEDFAPFLMVGDGERGQRGELFVGTIGGKPAGSVVRYFVAVTRDGERLAEDPAGGDIEPYAFEILP